MITLSGTKLILEQPGNGLLTLTRWKLDPIGFKELGPYFAGKKIGIRLFDLQVKEGPALSEITIEAVFPLFAQSASIVPGGWLPPSLALPNAIAFTDRNFVSHLSSQYENGKIKKPPDIRSNFESIEELDFFFDVIPFAIEGNIRGRPSRALIKSQIEEAAEKVKRALPRAQVMQYPDAVDYIEQIIMFCEDIFLKRQKFFFEFSKVERPKVSLDKVVAEWNEILKLAATFELSKSDLGVLTALLIVSCNTTDWPGRRIIKPVSGYTMEDAYNAASDYLIFELFLGMRKRYPNSTYSLMTGDKYLLALSALLGPLTHVATQETLGTYKFILPLDVFGGDVKMQSAFLEFYSKNIASSN